MTSSATSVCSIGSAGAITDNAEFAAWVDAVDARSELLRRGVTVGSSPAITTVDGNTYPVRGLLKELGFRSQRKAHGGWQWVRPGKAPTRLYQRLLQAHDEHERASEVAR